MPQIPINDSVLYYELHGQGPPLVFIHGLGSSTQDWAYQVAALAPTYTVLTFDLRGHGQSARPPGPYTIPLFAADTAGLLQALDIGAAHIVGVSLGGSVAFQLALDAPTQVKTLTIVNSAPGLPGSAAAAQQEIDRRVALVQQMGMRAMGEALSPNLFPHPEHAALRQSFVERWATNDPAAYIAATRALLGWDVGDQIGAIRCPTLVIAADQDYSPVAVKAAYVQRMPDARLVVIPATHHAVPMETPEQFTAVLVAFLAEQR
ncbi:MAG TPA: alpha/beta hydrolase [Chloroflexia bacterium]|nr:alpha/beta hydrolase [Chloroflexia bacterium]